jgi:hypothetical protein
MFGSGKSHRLARVSIFLTAAALIAGLVGCDGCNPPPTQNLEIQTWYDLDAVRDNLAGHHTLMNDLDSTTPGYAELASPTANGGKGWQPIGFYTPHGPTAYVGFRGVFDGQGYEIRDLYINRPDEDSVGLFGETDGAVIRDTGVVNVTAIGDECVAGLVGTNGGIVSKCYSIGSMVGKDGVGGLVAANWGTVSNSYSSGNITGISGVGGLVGVNGPDKTVSNSHSTGNVTGVRGVGGLVGFHVFAYRGTVTNSFWDTETSGQATSGGGTGKTTAEMKNITTFSSAGWNITAVANPGIRNPSYIWNVVNGVTYPFLSWQP